MTRPVMSLVFDRVLTDAERRTSQEACLSPGRRRALSLAHKPEIPGLPRYAKQAVDQQFACRVMLHVQSNPLPVRTRPRVLIKGKRT
jgi:Phage major capsid protein E